MDHGQIDSRKRSKNRFAIDKRLCDLELKYPVNINYHKDKHFSRLATEFLAVLRESV